MVSDGAARLVAACNAHDLDAVMSFFADDPVLELPRGPHPWGQRFQGPAEVRSGWPAASPASPMSTTARTVTGSVATGDWKLGER